MVFTKKVLFCNPGRFDFPFSQGNFHANIPRDTGCKKVCFTSVAIVLGSENNSYASKLHL